MSMKCPRCHGSIKPSKASPSTQRCSSCGYTVATPAVGILVAKPAKAVPKSAREPAPPATNPLSRRWMVFAGLLICLASALGIAVVGWAANGATPPEQSSGTNNPGQLVEDSAPASKPQEKVASTPAAVANDVVSGKVEEPSDVFVKENAEAAQQKKPALTDEEQRKVNVAIAKGVRYLRNSLAGSGQVGTGRTALAALTLLECGVPGKDPVVVAAAGVVRSAASHLRDTYSLSLAILFLDRLGNPEDEKLIRTFAARLIAGQNGRGGWTYECPVLTGPDERILLTMLRDLPPLKTILSRPAPQLHDPISGSKLSQPNTSKPVVPLHNPLPKTAPREQGLPELSSPLRNPLPTKESGLPKSIRKEPATPAGSTTSPGDHENRNRDAEQKRGGSAEPLPSALKNVPALQVVSGKETKLEEKKQGGDDNSNTQFAILGLWAARKHGVPMDRTLVLVERRFRTSQNADGSWGYHIAGREQPDSMTCTGLLGMALALGADLQLQGQMAGQAMADPAVKKGFAYLGTTIGKAPGPVAAMGKGKKSGRLIGADARGDLYYLWSLERVAVAYGVRTVGQKDWYRWGANVIVANQQADGSWKDRYASIPDTSFALLFLCRANLVRDLPRLTILEPHESIPK